MYSMKLFLPDTHGIIHKNEPFWLLHSLDFPSFFFQTIQVERTWDLVRDSGQRKLTYSSQNHCTSTLRSGRRKTIVSQTMCAPAERLSQSEIVLPLRKTCYYSPLAEVGVFSTEVNTRLSIVFPNSATCFHCLRDILHLLTLLWTFNITISWTSGK